MRKRIAAMVVALLMVYSAFVSVVDLGPLSASAAVGDEVLWQYGQTGVGGTGSGQLQDPGSADVLDNGSLLIMDVGNQRAIEVDPSGDIVWQYGQTGVGGTGFNQVGATAWLAQRLKDNNTLITDTQNHRIIEVDPDKSVVWQYGVTGSTSVLYYPRDAERLANGNTIVADTDHNRIVEVNEGLTEVWSYSCSGVALPSDVDRLANGNTLISEPDNYRVIEVDSGGNIVWQYGVTGSGGYGEGQLGLLWDADRLANGNTLITDTQYHRVIEVTPSKEIVWQYGKNATSGTGRDLLFYPWEADRLSNGSTLITEKGNHRVIIVGAGDGNVTVLFSDGFGGDLSAWDLYGTPKPFIDNGAIKGAGDGNYGSDAVTKASFDRTLGDLIIEARITVSQTLRPGWFGYGSVTSGNPDVDPSETVYYGFRFQGTLYGERVSFTYLDAEGKSASSSIPWTKYDEWHAFRVEVLAHGGADFFIDDQMAFSVPVEDRERVWSNESVIVGSHDPPYWFDDIVVLRRKVPPLVPDRFGLTVTTDDTVYDPGETVGVSAFHWNVATALPVGGRTVSFQVDAPDGTTMLVRSEETLASGWANFTFQVPVDGDRGPYTLFSTTPRVNASTTFRVGRIPLFILSVTVGDTYMPGQLMTVEVVAGSSVGEVSDLLLVAQILDPDRVPYPPVMDPTSIPPYELETTRLSWTVPIDARPGLYELQVQLMTGLPRDGGYSVDVHDVEFSVA